jgi:ketosteroid isomerase-like protein
MKNTARDRGGGDTGRAMSQENVEIIRRGFEAYERGDIPAMLSDADPDVITYRADPAPETYHGPEGFLQAFADWVEDFAEFAATAEEFLDVNDSQILVRVHQRAVGAASGAPIEADFWFLWTVRDLKVARLDMYARKAEALEAVGLRE